MHSTVIPTNDFAANDVTVKSNHQPPVHGAPQRDVIGGVVDGVAQTFCQQITVMREALDKLEQQYLESAANAKGALNDHVAVSAQLNSEALRLHGVIAAIGGRIES
jgi:Ethanolamine utilization protein EutJ (predicted chaperonin)